MPWTVGRVIIDVTDGVPRLLYELVTAAEKDDVLIRRDDRNRLALEAFSALRLDEMEAALDGYVASARAKEAPPEPRRMRHALGELVAFVERFGPLGIGWPRVVPVRNPAADEAERRLAASEERPSTNASAPDPSRWVVEFDGRAHPLMGGTVRRLVPRPGSQPRDDEVLLPGDALSLIRDEQSDLRMAIAFADVIAQNDTGATRALIRDTPWQRHVSLRAADPRGPDWRRVRRGRRVLGRGRWDPFDPDEDVDWGLMPKVILGRLIERQLGFATPHVTIDGLGRFVFDDRPATALELIYRQLLEHVRERQGYGIGWCGYCGGAILRTRLPESPTANQWHDGRCANAGRARRHRERRAQGGTPRRG